MDRNSDQVRVTVKPEGAYRLTEEECETILRHHCYQPDPMVYPTIPPQHPETCIHCGKRRVAIPNEPFTYREAR